MSRRSMSNSLTVRLTSLPLRVTERRSWLTLKSCTVMVLLSSRSLGAPMRRRIVLMRAFTSKILKGFVM